MIAKKKKNKKKNKKKKTTTTTTTTTNPTNPPPPKPPPPPPQKKKKQQKKKKKKKKKQWEGDTISNFGSQHSKGTAILFKGKYNIEDAHKSKESRILLDDIKVDDLDPVVQSVVSLTSPLRVISLTVLADSIYNILICFAENMCVAFALQILLTFFQQKISVYLHITQCKF